MTRAPVQVIFKECTMTRAPVQVIFKETEDFIVQRLLSVGVEEYPRPIGGGADASY